MSVDYFTRVQASNGWQRILESFTRFVEPRTGQHTLDVGCGPGALVRAFANKGCLAVGVDSDAIMVRRAKTLAKGLTHASFRAGNVLALDFPDNAFDLVTATNVIFLLPDPAKGLAEMARVCRPGGWVAVLNPSPMFSRAAAQAHAQALNLEEFDVESLFNWGALAEAHHRLSAEDLTYAYSTCGLEPPLIAEKIGPGLALFAKGQKVGK